MQNLSTRLVPSHHRWLVRGLGMIALGLGGIGGVAQLPGADVQFIILSDVHFGYIRKSPVPHTGTTTDALTINGYLLTSLNAVSGMTFPSDGGVGAGTTVGPIDMIAVTGDMANRNESGDGIGTESANQVQSDAASWAQFTSVYLTGVTLQNKAGAQPPFLLSPGNHDISNAIGQRYIIPANIDDTSMRQMLSVATGSPPLAAGTIDQAYFTATNASGAFINKPNYSLNIGGVHFISISAWPDTGSRKWIDADLAAVPLTTPVMIFTHCYPDADPTLLSPPLTTSPYSTVAGPPTTAGAVNDNEAVISDVIDQSEYASDTSSNVEQAAMTTWIKTHPNIVAYFHGHTNYNEMYEYNGPNKDIALNCFRIDSPMKGALSATSGKESLLSFDIATLDTTTGRMTVREIRWYPTPAFSTDVTTTNPDTGANSTFSSTNTPMETVYTKLAAPGFSVPAGSYGSAQDVSLISGPGTTVYYTTDGSTPTTSSFQYNGQPINVTATMTITALAVSNKFSSQAPSTSVAADTISGATGTGTGTGSGSTAATAGSTAGAVSSSSSSSKCGSGGGMAALAGLGLLLALGLLRRHGR